MKLLTINTRCLVLCLLVVTVTSALAYRIVQIQILDSEQNQARTQKTYTDTEVLKYKRGLILDKRENILANNITSCNLIADRYRLDDPRMAALGLAYAIAANSPGWDTLDEKKQNRLIEQTRRKIYINTQKEEEEISVDRMAILEDLMARSGDDSEETVQKSREAFDEDALKDLISKHEDYAIDIISQRLKLDKQELLDKLRNTKAKRIVLVQGLSEGEMELLQKDLRTMKVQGFSFEKNARRYYTMPKALVHVLGYTDHEGHGMMGIEKSLDRYLSGQDGIRRMSRDARGLPLSSSLDETKPAVHGLNLRLTIDMNIQMIVEEELDAGMKEFNAERAAVIMVEPKTGNIMAMACRPSFDLNEKLQVDLEKGALNYCVQGIYEPGSTFKIVAAAGALDTKKATLNTMFDCGNRVYNDGIVQLTDTASYGMRPLQGVVQKSSNIGTYKVGLRLGATPFLDYLNKFGFNHATGIDLASESRGNVRNVHNRLDFSRICIGYAVNVTPIQMVMAYAAIANDGVLMRPRLVDRIFDVNNKTVESETTKPQEVRRVLSSKAARDMRTALASVTEKGGTGTQGKIDGFTVGAKTGTARRHVPGVGYRDGQYTVSFCGMVPAENPAFICLVVVDNPRTTSVSRFGGTIAAPIFKKIATRTVAALNLEPQKEESAKR